MKLLITQGEFNANPSLISCTNGYQLVSINQKLNVYCDIIDQAAFTLIKPVLNTANYSEGILIPAGML